MTSSSPAVQSPPALEQCPMPDPHPLHSTVSVVLLPWDRLMDNLLRQYLLLLEIHTHDNLQSPRIIQILNQTRDHHQLLSLLVRWPKPKYRDTTLQANQLAAPMRTLLSIPRNGLLSLSLKYLNQKSFHQWLRKMHPLGRWRRTKRRRDEAGQNGKL